MKTILSVAALLCMWCARPSSPDSLANGTAYKDYFAASSRVFGACDACGCSASGGGMGFSSMLDSDFVGLRYLYQRYSSRDGIFAHSPRVAENFNTMQLWARIPVAGKLQLSALVPVHFHDRETVGGRERISGLGDITLLALYTVLETRSDSAVVSHQLQLGAGVKLPSGRYDAANNQGSVNPGFQVGTGSWDYPLALEYVLRYRRWGLHGMANYIVKSANDEAYRFGDQFNYAATLFYLSDGERPRLAPQLGLAGEVSAANRQYGQRLADTGGTVLFSKFGLEAGKGNFSVGANLMLPLAQRLNAGNVKAEYRLGVNLNYTL